MSLGLVRILFGAAALVAASAFFATAGVALTDLLQQYL
jgi:hypothetical protein